MSRRSSRGFFLPSFLKRLRSFCFPRSHHQPFRSRWWLDLFLSRFKLEIVSNIPRIFRKRICTCTLSSAKNGQSNPFHTLLGEKWSSSTPASRTFQSGLHKIRSPGQLRQKLWMSASLQSDLNKERIRRSPDHLLWLSNICPLRSWRPSACRPPRHCGRVSLPSDAASFN